MENRLPKKGGVRLVAYVAIALFGLCRTIQRMIIESPIGAFDWCMFAIEVGILALVAYLLVVRAVLLREAK
jgi:hypothetical protein